MRNVKWTMVLGSSIVLAYFAAGAHADESNAFSDSLPGAEQLADKPGIEGVFKIKGRGENDKADYTGTATISKIGGDMYNGSWKIGSNTFKGICFRDDDQLSCAWAVKTEGLGVVAYLVKDDGLDGVWFQTGGTKLGKEYLKPSGKMTKKVHGSFNIHKGENPDGSKYSGSAVVDLVQDGVYTFKWTIGGTKIKGLGIRLTGGDDDVVATAFDTGGDYGALQYKISENGKELSGAWAQSLSGKITKGTEALAKGSK